MNGKRAIKQNEAEDSKRTKARRVYAAEWRWSPWGWVDVAETTASYDAWVDAHFEPLTEAEREAIALPDLSDLFETQSCPWCGMSKESHDD
jgi:hypothetical protein